MAKVVWSNGIDYISGALNKVGKGQHNHEKMLIGTHRVAATTSNKCNRLYLRRKVERSTLPTSNEMDARTRFATVGAAVRTRAKDLMHISEDQAAFEAQKNLASGKKTFRAYLWAICGADYDAQHS